MPRKIITVYDEDAEDEKREVDLPGKWEICWRCQGDGVVDCFDDGFTGDEEWCDEDFRVDYENGVYDKGCPECGGSGKIIVINEDRLTADQREIVRKYEQDLQLEAQMAAEDAHTRWAEGGWAER